jgi:hypothetical protein
MPDPFLTDRVNELAHNLVEELENIMADRTREPPAPWSHNSVVCRTLVTSQYDPS